MSLMTRDNSETSVTFSLVELARIEEERVREEDARRAQARQKEAQEQREAAARRRAAEAAQLAADDEARARRVRAEAEERARTEARERAAVEVARIEAQARIQLDAANAARAHELAVLRARTEGGRRRLVVALASALGLVLCGGSAAAYGVSQKVAGLTQDAAQLREGQQALAREREQAKTTQLSSLDRRFTALRMKALIGEAQEARATAESARNAIDVKTLDQDRLRAFGDALDALDARLATLGKVADLDRRRAALDAWAASRKLGESTTEAQIAATRARRTVTDEDLRGYEVALDRLQDKLARDTSPTVRGAPRSPKVPTSPGAPCLPGDPGCSFDGRTF